MIISLRMAGASHGQSCYRSAMLEFVDVATAKSAAGVRIAVSGLVPSPWSEATKGVFRVAGVRVLAVRRMRDAAEVQAWTNVDNVPVVFHDAEPVRTHWAAITELASRLAGPDALLSDDAARRADQIGLIDTIAGEDGIGWNGRLAMIEASLASDGARGFPAPVAKYLARRYGHTPAAFARTSARIAGQLALLRDRLRGSGGDYVCGARVSAVDVYLATFLTPVLEIGEHDCPALEPVLRRAFRAAHEAFGELVADELRAHRKMMFERHLAWPIEL
jgi:glutathione S-transferase